MLDLLYADIRNNFHSFKIVGIFLQSYNLVKSNFSLFSNRRHFPTSCFNLQTEEISVRFGPIRINLSFFSNRRYFPTIFIQLGSIHIFQIVAILLRFGPMHIKLSLFSNRRYFPTILQFGQIKTFTLFKS